MSTVLIMYLTKFGHRNDHMGQFEEFPEKMHFEVRKARVNF